MSTTFYALFALGMLLVGLGAAEVADPAVGWIGFGLMVALIAQAVFAYLPGGNADMTDPQQRWEQQMVEADRQQVEIRRQIEAFDRHLELHEKQFVQAQLQMDKRARQLDAEEQKLRLEEDNARRMAQVLTTFEKLAASLDRQAARWELPGGPEGQKS